MRILYVLEHYHPYIGGAEKLFRNVASSMAEQGHEVVVVTTRFDRALPKNETFEGVEISRITCYNRFFFTFVAIFKLLTLGRSFDYVHATTYNAAFPAWLFSKLRGITSILTFHEVWGRLWFKLPFLSWWEKYLFYIYEKMVIHLSFDHYVAVSRYTEDSLRQAGIRSDKITLIYNGLDYKDAPVYTNRDFQSPFTMAYFGRLGVSKGLDLLIPSMHRLISEEERVKLHLIIPRQPEKLFTKIIGMTHDGPAQQSITFHHELSKSELNTLVRQVDAVVVPSYSEGFCFVAAEACALGKPVIHSGKGALAEVVSGRQIIMESMTVDSLVKSIKLGIHDQWDVSQLHRFELSQSIAEYLQLYDGL